MEIACSPQDDMNQDAAFLRFVALKVVPIVKRRSGPCWLLLLALLVSACNVPFIGNMQATPLPTPPPDQILNFQAPIYRVTLEPGDAVPGTQIRYVDHENEVYNVTIDGLPAARRVGDSLIWKGVIAPGVLAKYNLRISPTFFSDNIMVVGPVEVSVLNPVPVELESLPPESEEEIHFSSIETDLQAIRGDQIPGTSLVYEGMTERGAQLSGTERYPYWALGDSLVWAGRLRSNVTVRYSLRFTTIEEERIVLPGTVELRISLNR